MTAQAKLSCLLFYISKRPDLTEMFYLVFFFVKIKKLKIKLCHVSIKLSKKEKPKP